MVQLVSFNDGLGGMEGYALGEDHAVYQAWRIPPEGRAWSNWHRLGIGSAKQLCVATDQLGRTVLFVLGTDGMVHFSTRMGHALGGGDWNAWASLYGHGLQQIAVGANANGLLDVFALGDDRVVYHISETKLAVRVSAWGGWASLGGRGAKSISLGHGLDGRLELFAIRTDGLLYQAFQDGPSGNWGQWLPIGDFQISQAISGNVKDGRLMVFALERDGSVSFSLEVKPGQFAPWGSVLGSHLRRIALSNNADDRIELFGVGADLVLYNIPQNPNAPTGWGAWGFL
jgi:hypothetical protein